jgi:hypothetical protein
MGTADVRFNSEATQVITMADYDGTDSFVIRYRQGDGTVEDTVAFVRGTNATAAAIQAALRSLTGFDATCTVAGDTDAGPWTVTFVGSLNGGQQLLELITLSGCSGRVTRTLPTYVAALGRVQDYGTDTGQPTASFPGETNMVGVDVPLGFSLENGETAGVALPPPTITSATGGAGQVSLTATEEGVATNAVIMYALKNKDTGAMRTTVTEDADGTVTITGLDAGDWVVYAYTQTLITADPDPESARVSRPSPGQHFTVT